MILDFDKSLQGLLEIPGEDPEWPDLPEVTAEMARVSERLHFKRAGAHALERGSAAFVRGGRTRLLRHVLGAIVIVVPARCDPTAHLTSGTTVRRARRRASATSSRSARCPTATRHTLIVEPRTVSNPVTSSPNGRRVAGEWDAAETTRREEIPSAPRELKESFAASLATPASTAGIGTYHAECDAPHDSDVPV